MTAVQVTQGALGFITAFLAGTTGTIFAIRGLRTLFFHAR